MLQSLKKIIAAIFKKFLKKKKERGRIKYSSGLRISTPYVFYITSLEGAKMKYNKFSNILLPSYLK